jgi:hypothetical protein
MALVQNTLIGKASGSVGNATFAGWKGKQVLKSKSTNSYSAPTTEQLNNNSKFATITAFARSILVFIVAGFKAGAVGKSEYNVFTQENRYSQVVTGSPGSYKVNTEIIQVSKGPEFTTNLSAISKEADGANSIAVNWTPSSNIPDGSIAHVMAFSRSLGQFITGVSTPVEDSSINLTATGIGTNIDTTDVYLFYVNALTGKACDSIWVDTL